jgi:hypothetical protein
MPTSQNFGFYRNPRFSANHISEYLTAEDARHREEVIRKAKFPQKPSVIPYSQAKRSIRDFIVRNTHAMSTIDTEIARFTTILSREEEGWMQGEWKRNIACLKMFSELFKTRRMNRFRFSQSTADLTLKLDSVAIHTRLDANIVETGKDGVERIGGCLVFTANTEQARRNIEARLKYIASLIHWTLQETDKNRQPLERLCISCDIFGGTLTPAPTAIDRLRTSIRSSCHEAAARWPSVAPPAAYDGPDWR